MRITIHRGADRIGGSVTEYEHDGWKLFVDFGGDCRMASVNQERPRHFAAFCPVPDERGICPCPSKEPQCPQD